MATSATLPQTASPQGRASMLSRAFSGDSLARAICFLSATAILAVTVLLVWELWSHSLLSRQKFGFRFLGTSAWDPVAQQFGALPFIFGTVVTSAVGLCLGVPFGVGAAIFLAELAPPKLSDAMTF